MQKLNVKIFDMVPNMCRILNMLRVLNICKFSLIWQGCQYARGCNYGRVLDISGFRVCQVSAYASVAQDTEYAWIWQNNTLEQGSEYAWSTFHRGLNTPAVLNMLGLRMWQGCEYARVTQEAEYAWITLNMPYVWICLNNS